MKKEIAYTLQTNEEQYRVYDSGYVTCLRLVLFVGSFAVPALIAWLVAVIKNWINTQNEIAAESSYFDIGIFFLGVIVFGVTSLVLYYRLALKAYGLNQRKGVWIVDFDSHIAVKVYADFVSEECNSFDETSFICTADNDDCTTYTVRGRNMYFSEHMALSVLLWTERVNGEILEQYYPDWEIDKDFVEYYNNKQSRRRYLSCQADAKTDVALFILAVCEINGHECYPIDGMRTAEEVAADMFEDYIQEKRKENKSVKRKQSIKSEMLKLRLNECVKEDAAES